MFIVSVKLSKVTVTSCRSSAGILHGCLQQDGAPSHTVRNTPTFRCHCDRVPLLRRPNTVASLRFGNTTFFCFTKLWSEFVSGPNNVFECCSGVIYFLWIDHVYSFPSLDHVHIQQCFWWFLLDRPIAWTWDGRAVLYTDEWEQPSLMRSFSVISQNIAASHTLPKTRLFWPSFFCRWQCMRLTSTMATQLALKLPKSVK